MFKYNSISLTEAEKAVDKVIEEARGRVGDQGNVMTEREVAPVAIAIVGRNGEKIIMKAMDKTLKGARESCIFKARKAVGAVNKGESPNSGGGMEFVTDKESNVIAGIGVSGRKKKTMSKVGGVPQDDRLVGIAKETLMEEIK